jgi:high affinity Mn2+ porin
MPKVANGPFLDADIARARGDNLELELQPAVFGHYSTAVRLLSYVNHADMGSYREAIDDFRTGLVSKPDIIAVRRQGRKKYGFGLNLEQALPHDLRAFARWGWNDGRNESFAYTEVDRTGAIGLDLKGAAWSRKLDKIGAAFVINGLSGDHREYLALGGLGFVLGDGRLNYGNEQIFEGYYTAHLWRGVFGALDVQHITNPGYNRDRGPVLAPAVRLHIDF